MSSAPLRRIILTGFMGSGKTTVGRLLAARLGWTFVDLDHEITRRCALTVAEVFARFGEPYFRQEESQALAACLTREYLVLALGGGAPEREDNRTLLRESPSTAVIYLSGPFETLQARCIAQSAQSDAVSRPLLADARQRFSHRAPLYAEMATVTVDSAGSSPEETAQTILDVLSCPTSQETGG